MFLCASPSSTVWLPRVWIIKPWQQQPLFWLHRWRLPILLWLVLNLAGNCAAEVEEVETWLVCHYPVLHQELLLQVNRAAQSEHRWRRKKSICIPDSTGKEKNVLKGPAPEYIWIETHLGFKWKCLEQKQTVLHLHRETTSLHPEIFKKTLVPHITVAGFQPLVYKCDSRAHFCKSITCKEACKVQVQLGAWLQKVPL